MTYNTWKERQTNGSLFEKTLSLQVVKNIIVQKKGVWVYTTINVTDLELIDGQASISINLC